VCCLLCPSVFSVEQQLGCCPRCQHQASPASRILPNVLSLRSRKKTAPVPGAPRFCGWVRASPPPPPPAPRAPATHPVAPVRGTGVFVKPRVGRYKNLLQTGGGPVLSGPRFHRSESNEHVPRTSAFSTTSTKNIEVRKLLPEECSSNRHIRIPDRPCRALPISSPPPPFPPDSATEGNCGLGRKFC